MSDIIACGPACCPGCEDCYGTGMGCHQVPCRCDKPCTCRWAEELDSSWRAGCERHDDSGDQRNDEPEWPQWPEWSRGDDVIRVSPCPVCGEYGACGYDDMGRQLYHPMPEESDL